MPDNELKAADDAWQRVVDKALIDLKLNTQDATALTSVLRDAVRAEVQYQTGMSKRELPRGTSTDDVGGG